MNIKRFALGGFKHSRDEVLLVRSNTVYQAMNNNAFFPDPDPKLEDLLLLIEDFEGKLFMARRKGSPQDTAEKNEARLALIKGLKQLAFYVSRIADGALPLLLSSGFELSGYPQGGIVPDVVRGILLSDGRQSGQMRMDFASQKNVLLYEYRFAYRQDDEGNKIWEAPFTTSSSRNNIISPLLPQERYYVQVRAVNTYGKSDWNEPVSYVVR